jgi:hypothetical protein
VISSTRALMALDRRPDHPAIVALDKKSVRTIDRDGRLHIAMPNNISKATVDPYYGHEIPDGEKLNLDPDKIYYLLRHPDEMEKGAATFNNLPILSEHIPVSAEAPQQELVIGSTGTDAVFTLPYLQNSAVIWVQDAIDDIEAEIKKEWSCGYYYRADMTPGNFNGLRFDGIMRDIVGNHVALVDEGRAGPDVVVGDSMPKGLTMLKSRRALMLNGALAALIAPKLAQDAKLDLSGVLSGVTASTLPKTGKALATKIIAATKGKLAQDESLDADDVVKVIAAVQGVTDVPVEDDEIEDAAADGDADAPAVDADDDKVAKILAFLKGKISDEDMAELGTMCGEGAADEEPDAPPGGRKPGDMPNKPAMDAAAISRTIGTTVAEMRQAERDVAPIIGEIKVPVESASAIYKLALDHKKIDTKGVHPSAFRAMVAMLPKDGDVQAPLALDHASVANDFASRFPEAGKLIVS